MKDVLLVTDRMNAAIQMPTYTMEQEAGGAMHVSYETERFTLHAEKGVTYTIAGGGPALAVTITGPGMQPVKSILGQGTQFVAPANGTYTISVASPEIDTGVMAADRPLYGAFYLDVYTNVPDDIGLVLQPSNVITQPTTVATFKDTITAPVYELDSAGKPVKLQSFDTDTFTIKAAAGDYYGLTTTGAAGLTITITGPGFFYKMEDGTTFEAPLDGNVGDPLGFQATKGGTYTVTVQSATTKTAISSEDRPNSGSYTIDVKKTEGEDIDRVISGEVFTTNTELKGNLGTASDADQIYGTMKAGSAMFIAVNSKDVKDITLEVLDAGKNANPLKGVTATDGFTVLDFTSPASAMYELLIRSGSYYQEGDYQAFGGQRFAPTSALTVGRPEGGTISYTDNVDREVWGWGGDTNITTGGGNDVLVGTLTGSDRLISGAGDDDIYVAGGNDYADGGDGQDVVYFPGIKELVTIGKSGDKLIISGTIFISGQAPISTTATLKNVEYVEFMNGVYEVAMERYLPGIVHFDKPGNEVVTGGKSVEGVVYHGNRSAFSVVIGDTETTVVDKVGKGGVNHLTSVEKLLFDDVTTQIDFRGTTGKMGTFNEMGTAGRAAVATLSIWGKQGLSDKVLVGQVIDYFSDGAEDEDAAFLLWGSGMLEDAVGSDSDADTVTFLYKNIAGVAPTAQEHAEIMKLFDNPDFTKVDLLEFAFNHPVQINVLSDLGYIDHGIDFIAVPPIELEW